MRGWPRREASQQRRCQDVPRRGAHNDYSSVASYPLVALSASYVCQSTMGLRYWFAKQYKTRLRSSKNCPFIHTGVYCMIWSRWRSLCLPPGLFNSWFLLVRFMDMCSHRLGIIQQVIRWQEPIQFKQYTIYMHRPHYTTCVVRVLWVSLKARYATSERVWLSCQMQVLKPWVLPRLINTNHNQ